MPASAIHPSPHRGDDKTIMVMDVLACFKHCTKDSDFLKILSPQSQLNTLSMPQSSILKSEETDPETKEAIKMLEQLMEDYE